MARNTASAIPKSSSGRKRVAQKARRSPAKRETNGSDVIAFTDSINRGFSSEFFGEERRNSVRKLVIAAIECFDENGFHPTTTRDIARRARMSPAALYVHFRTKNELLFKLTVVTASAMLHDLKRASASSSSPTERLRAIVATYVRCNARMHTTVRVATYEFGALDRNLQKAVVGIRQEVNQIFVDCLEEGRAKGEFRFQDVQLLRVAIMSLCISVSRWFSFRGPLTPEEVGEVYAEYVLKMVR
jgi:AcrR family transcriptional regulator